MLEVGKVYSGEGCINRTYFEVLKEEEDFWTVSVAAQGENVFFPKSPRFLRRVKPVNIEDIALQDPDRLDDLIDAALDLRNEKLFNKFAKQKKEMEALTK